MAVRDGRVLFSEGPVQAVSIVFSLRKSVLSMVYGKYVASGAIDLDRTLGDLRIDDIGGLLPIERQATLRDMARLGYLMLRRGNWRGQQLIPEDWVARMTRQTTAAAQMHPARTARRGFGYGYLWWLLDEPADSPLHGAYMAWGGHGQYILVVPNRELVIAHKRQVPVEGNRDVSWVGPVAFLRAARMLAAAPCAVQGMR